MWQCNKINFKVYVMKNASRQFNQVPDIISSKLLVFRKALYS